MTGSVEPSVRTVTKLAETSQPDRSDVKASRSTAHVKWLKRYEFEVYADGQIITLGEPELVGLETLFNPTPFLLASIGTSLSTRYITNAADQGTKIESLDVWVECAIDYQKEKQVSDIAVRVYLKSDASADILNALNEHVLQSSPYSEALANRIDFTIEKIDPDWEGLTWCVPS